MFPRTSAPWHLPVQLNLEILPGMVEQGEAGKWGRRWENGMQSEGLPLLLMDAAVRIKERNLGNFFRAKPPSQGQGTVSGSQHHPQ